MMAFAAKYAKWPVNPDTGRASHSHANATVPRHNAAALLSQF